MSSDRILIKEPLNYNGVDVILHIWINRETRKVVTWRVATTSDKDILPKVEITEEYFKTLKIKHKMYL